MRLPRSAALLSFFALAHVHSQDLPAPPALEFAFEVRAEVADPLVIGELPNGTRRIIDIIGGTVEGPNISGRVRPGGADWQMIRSGGLRASMVRTCTGDVCVLSKRFGLK